MTKSHLGGVLDRRRFVLTAAGTVTSAGIANLAWPSTSGAARATRIRTRKFWSLRNATTRAAAAASATNDHDGSVSARVVRHDGRVLVDELLSAE